MKKNVNKVQSVPASVILAHVFLLSACVLAAGCKPVEKAPVLGEGNMIEIRQGTAGGSEGLRIGLSNIIETDYTGPAGEKKHGLEAVLVLFIKGEPPQEKRFDTHIGDTVSLGKYSVYVQEISGGSKGSVKLQVKTSEKL